MAYKVMGYGNQRFNEFYNNPTNGDIKAFASGYKGNIPIFNANGTVDHFERVSSTSAAGPALSTSEIQKVMQSSGIFSRQSISDNQYTKYSRFGYIDPYHNRSSNREFLFFTKPDLNIFGEDDVLTPSNIAPSEAMLNSKLRESSTLFRDAVRRHFPVLKQLQYNASLDEGPFMYLLSNRVTSSLDMPGISAEQVESATNMYGTTISYRSHSIKSDQAHNFTLSFNDSEYLEIYMLAKLYDEYHRLLKLGRIQPKRIYIDERILDDCFSIYKIIVAEDGETILYWAKDTGVMLLDVPRSDFGEAPQDGFKYSLSFYGHFVEDMDPNILSDFNRVASMKPSTNKSPEILFDTTNEVVSNSWAMNPRVELENRSAQGKTSRRQSDGLGSYVYKLKWYN